MSELNIDLKDNISNEVGHCLRTLDASEVERLHRQDLRGIVGEFQQEKLEKEAVANWDKFYKRNETRFFKDRHWTTREFQELIGDGEKTRSLLEVGCGVGNFLYPLLEERLNLFIYACDFSPRAVQFVKSHSLYDASKMDVFQCDITKDELRGKLSGEVDIISMIFVLSAIHPEKFKTVVSNLYECLKPGGMVLVRDYGLYDMAMLRFGPGSKLGERFYVRQDGTRAYYFTDTEMCLLFEEAGFVASSVGYVSRQTVNKKEGINAQRIFVQAKFVRPSK
ncbi:tRNA N(3)-methylcytidine methyltransferase METTL6 [Procambarus clarkii]|uniref:tRNA N(3)-methylcytidine methyltransferase METTL6 n=1 Tax=Procambarus clarkii TaxID=6728 RepID=UPI001E671C5F|nr:tRNA N(3)-methylcytidine methyltransferase METTL6-like [Procambarus clarkii]XP_045598765.1 tRNA N(3)-methylcytidine methyltransferase METTL6-like [Procambarus clarkii]XP_045598766.1 tRNA N(3)-methylcytidine methyltransferase METTL6-like [Procambarus clarkii]XP_045598767.1 tRNA N(3)-methylcytidine methyltransferase METTL6-like [Procambarus clarkii]XP_045598768.1 tRNA N(3)-methylcytidine methyltransferase METTL6-like [Procambarus clarkii]XP_045598769.1 tRNA N(3)-methylcytidine methyltransfera